MCLNKGTPEEGSCFSGQATVRTQDGRHVALRDVVPNTCVLTYDPSGSAIYSPIYLMAHAHPTAKLECIQIVTERAQLELSGGHFVIIVDDDEKNRYVTARNVKAGDVILVYDDAQGGFQPARVTSVGHVEREGKFAPFTLQGTIVVDGVAASCYEETCRVTPTWAHALLWPVRWAWRVSPFAFGFLSKPLGPDGLPAWVTWAMSYVLPLLPDMHGA